MAGIKGIGSSEKFDGSSLRIGIIHARWNTKIIDALVSGSKKSLLASGVKEENIVVESVPGSYELPFAVQRFYAASQLESTTSTAAGALSTLTSATTDLLSMSSSTTDLTNPNNPIQTHSTPSSQSNSSGPPSALKKSFDAVIAIGVLIKGETMHFEYISDAVSHGLMKVQLDIGVPVIFGLLTVMNEEQGLARAGLKGSEGGKFGKEGHNHGEDWGTAAVELGVKRGLWAEGKI